MTNDFWYPGAPSGGKYQHCMQFNYYRIKGAWDDTRCYYKKTFLCQKPGQSSLITEDSPVLVRYFLTWSLSYFHAYFFSFQIVRRPLICPMYESAFAFYQDGSLLRQALFSERVIFVFVYLRYAIFPVCVE